MTPHFEQADDELLAVVVEAAAAAVVVVAEQKENLDFQEHYLYYGTMIWQKDTDTAG